MKKLITILALLFPLSVFGAANSFIITQRDPGDSFNFGRIIGPPGGDAMMMYNSSTQLPDFLGVGSGMAITGGALVLSPGGTTSQYMRGDGSLTLFPSLATVATTGAYADLSGKPTIPAAFSFGFPFTRSLAQSTSVQASDNTKPAVITVSPACTNATTVLAASACTLQVRMNTSTVTCSTGTVYNTWTSTYALGLLLTNASGSPFDIKLPAGAFFILCPTAGTFTINAVEQSIG